MAVGANKAGGANNGGAVFLIKDGDGDGDFADATSNDVIEINNSTAGITLASLDEFGIAVALEGGILAVGARNDSTGGSERGAVVPDFRRR